jgi:hypothetical protein
LSQAESLMKLRYLIALLFFILPGLSFLRADVYQWTDAQGITHFGSQPPADARNVKLKIKEPAPGAEAQRDASGQSTESADTEAVIQDFEQDQQREEEERRRQSEEIKRKTPPTRTEIIARERERIEKKIQELENKPLEDFGSQRNKRNQIGFYQYRLQTLLASPEDYFNKPEKYEGNVKPTD